MQDYLCHHLLPEHGGMLHQITSEALVGMVGRREAALADSRQPTLSASEKQTTPNFGKDILQNTVK